MEINQTSNKELVISKKDTSPKYWMSEGEYTNIIVNAKQTNNEYVITDGIIEPNGFIPDHFHKWEDQTFHIVEGKLEAKIGEKWYELNIGDTIHCPRGISHFIRNNENSTARLISYIFPGNWAEEYFAETSKQNQTDLRDLKLIEDKYGVVYI